MKTTKKLSWENCKICLETFAGLEITQDLIKEVWGRNVNIIRKFYAKYGKENCFLINLNKGSVFKKEKPEDIKTFEADYIIAKRIIKKLIDLIESFEHECLFWV